MNPSSARIVLVGPLPPPAGGMAGQTEQLARLLRGEGIDVDVVQVNAPYRPAWVSGLRGLRAMCRLVPYLAKLWSAIGRADLVHLMANSGWSWHLFATPALWVAWLRRVPSIVNYRGGEAASFLERHAPVVRASMSRASLLVVPSGFLQEIFGRHGMVAEIVPNVVDLARFRPVARSDDNDRPHLVVTRNLEQIYGNDIAIRALPLISQAYPEAQLTIAGSGPCLASLQQLARSLGVAERVHFVGRLDRDGVAELYRDAHLMLNPSRVDNMPNAVLEALACGIPVVSSRVGGLPFMVEDGVDARLVAPDDPAAFASAALALLSDRETRTRMIRRGLENAHRHSWSAVKDQLFSAYRRALDGARQPGQECKRVP